MIQGFVTLGQTEDFPVRYERIKLAIAINKSNKRWVWGEISEFAKSCVDEEVEDGII